jgi:hypothetical protein
MSAAVLAKLRRLSDQITAATLMIHMGAYEHLEEWSGRPDPSPNGHVATDSNGTPVMAEHEDECPARRDATARCRCEGNPIEYNDPTGDSAGTRLDIHGYALREIDTLIDHLRMGLSTRQAEEVKASLPAPCVSCARITDHQGRPLYSPAHAKGLCRYCGAFEVEWKQRIPVSILRAYHDGRRPNRRSIERALAAKKEKART